MTEPRGSLSSFSVAHTRSHCLARADILHSPERPPCQAWLWGYYKKGKPIVPKNLLPLQKRGFPLLSKLSMEVIQATWKTSIAAFFWSSCWQIHQSWGQHDPSIVGLQKKGRLCVCFYTSCMWVLLICRAHVQPTALWNISICIAFSFAVTFAIDVDMNTLPVSVDYTLQSVEWRAPLCWHQSDGSHRVTGDAWGDLKSSNVPPWSLEPIVFFRGIGTSGAAPSRLQKQQF